MRENIYKEGKKSICSPCVLFAINGTGHLNGCVELKEAQQDISECQLAYKFYRLLSYEKKHAAKFHHCDTPPFHTICIIDIINKKCNISQTIFLFSSVLVTGEKIG